jgi:hypothetical protein
MDPEGETLHAWVLVHISSQNNKIATARPPDPTPNKGDVSSLTIVAYDIGLLVNVSRQTMHGLHKISHLYSL